VKKIARLVLVLLFLLVAVLSASSYARAGDDWIPIPPEDLALKDNPKQPGADAMVLYRQVDIDQGNSAITNYVRIKIFTQEGVKKEGNVEIEYNKSQEAIQGVRARTIQADGKITEFDGATLDKEIVKGPGRRYFAKTFSLPNVQPGCIIEFRYREQFSGYGYVYGHWVVQYDLFTRLARFSMKSRPSSLPLLTRSYRLYAENATIQRQGGGEFTLEVHDLPGIEEEPLMPSENSLRATVDFYYQDRDAPPNETTDQFWKRIGKRWNDELEAFLGNKAVLGAEVRQDVNNDDSPEVKLRKIYARVLKIRNLNLEEKTSKKEQHEEDLKKNNDAEDVLKHGYGTTWQINALMVGLTRAAGLEAAEVHVSSRNERIFYPQRRATSDLTDVLVWVRADSKEYYLDPGSRYFPFSVLAWDEYATDGIRLTKDGCDMIKTPDPQVSDASTTRRADLTIDPSASISGKLSIDFGRTESAYWRLDERDADEQGRKKALEDRIGQGLGAGSTFDISRVDNWDDVEKPLHIEGTVSTPSFAKTMEQRMLMPLEIFQNSESAFFQSEKRVNEIDFSYPYEAIDDIVVHVPPKFKTSAIPDPKKISPGPVSYEISATPLPEGYEVKRHLVISGIRYPKTSYTGLRNFFSLAKTDDNAQLMLESDQAAKSN
jgi:hypothetical protein